MLFHDLRRTGARNLRRAGVGEGIIMKIGGWRTSVFERYAIVSRSDMKDAILKLQESEKRAKNVSFPRHGNGIGPVVLEKMPIYVFAGSGGGPRR